MKESESNKIFKEIMFLQQLLFIYRKAKAGRVRILKTPRFIRLSVNIRSFASKILKSISLL